MTSPAPPQDMPLPDSPEEQTPRAKWLARLKWGAAFLCLGFILGFLFHLLSDPIPKEETLFVRIAPQLVLGLFGTVGGLITLWTYNRNHDQREREMQQRQQQFKDEQAQDKIHFARTEQANQFKDILDRFASADEKTRANAALRLGELAREILPGIEAGAVRNEANNPFFIPAASALSVGLMTEDSANVRQAIRDSDWEDGDVRKGWSGA